MVEDLDLKKEFKPHTWHYQNGYSIRSAGLIDKVGVSTPDISSFSGNKVASSSLRGNVCREGSSQCVLLCVVCCHQIYRIG